MTSSMMSLNRRAFLRGATITVAGAALGPVFSLGPGRAQSARTLVVLFQRGAMDGLHAVVPHGDSRYYELRPTLAIDRPGSDGGAIDLDGYFGFHPALSSLVPAYDAGELAVVHACGSPDPSRSHFDAQDFMESGRPGFKGGADGWLNRHLQTSTPSDSVYRGVALTSRLPLTLRGAADSLAVANLSQLSLGTGETGRIIRDTIEGMYGERDDLPGEVVRDSLRAIEIAGSLDPADYEPRNGAVYPRTAAGLQLVQIAQLIRAGVGLEVAFGELGGWDTHAQEINTLSTLLGQLGDALAAFRVDLGEDLADVCVVTLSEFGRTAAENGAGGTDHGHGTAMIAMGGTVNGGMVLGDWPGLEEDGLYQGRDLAVTTDFRSFLADVVEGHLGNANVEDVFPGFEDPLGQRPGVIR